MSNASAGHSKRDLKGMARIFLARNGTFIGVVVLIAFFASKNENFLSFRNAQVIGQSISELGVIAAMLALLVIAGAVDLSVGSVASMAGIIAGKVMVNTNSVPLGVAAGLVFGLGAGALNGLLVSFFRLNSIVVTLGTLAVWGGLALFVTDGQTVARLPESFTNLATAKPLGIEIQVVVLFVVLIVAWGILNRTPFGKRLYAIGGNERASYLMGINVRVVRFAMFVIVGLVASLAGIMYAAKLNAATPISGQGLELTALTVVLLGGVAFAGGAGRIGGVLAGLLFVGVLQNGLIVTGTSQFLQQIFLGVLLIAAVALDDTLRQFMRTTWIQRSRTDSDESMAVAGEEGGSPPGEPSA